MRFTAAALLIALGLAASAEAAADWTPDAALIAKMEAAIRIPASSGRVSPPLAKYARYYTGKMVSGRRVIEGMLLLPEASEKSGVYVRSANKMPLGIMDGGCGEVRLQYDVAASKFLFIQCNGLA